MSVFKFSPPSWVNTNLPPTSSAEDKLKRAHDMAQCLYPLGVQSSIHSMIEWCGVMGEYVRMLQHAYMEHQIAPENVDQHGGTSVPVPPYMVSYFCEKLGCQLKPFIRANPAVWNKEISKWFEGK
jgi:hypothetical protein